MNEEWRDIKGYEGIYQISNLEWSEITGINKRTIWKRYHKGWSSEEILKES